MCGEYLGQTPVKLKLSPPKTLQNSIKIHYTPPLTQLIKTTSTQILVQLMGGGSFSPKLENEISKLNL